MSATVWKPNGEISKESKVTEGNGKIIYYDSEGKEIYHLPVKDGIIPLRMTTVPYDGRF